MELMDSSISLFYALYTMLHRKYYIKCCFVVNISVKYTSTVILSLLEYLSCLRIAKGSKARFKVLTKVTST